MRSTAWRMTLAACLSLGLASPAGALAGGSPARAGDRLTRATVFITSLTPSGRDRAEVGNCTGVLIERDLVLTAGHCLSDMGGPSLVVAQFFDSSNRIVRTVQVASGALHPDYAGRASAEDPKPEMLGADLAILKLADPAPADRRPIALAARDASGPALMVFTRRPNLRPASNARVRVSLSSAALADDIPPPYPGITRSLAMYVSDTTDPPGRIRGPSRCTMDTSE